MFPMNPEPISGLNELAALDATLAERFVQQRDSAAKLVEELPKRFSPQAVALPGNSQRIWELVGVVYKNSGRIHEALAIFWRLYQHMLASQVSGTRVHKGMPLCWIADCFGLMGFRTHAKRFLMLTLCEDALRENGKITPDSGGIYFRLVWQGLRDADFHRYAAEFWRLHNSAPESAGFPEALLQQVDSAWVTELPAPQEALFYLANEVYVRYLLDSLGDGSGQALEKVAQYLLSCMPGCRTTRRLMTHSTDYDVVCSMDGFDLDFRSEFGRYFLCECKDWAKPADITAMAKFCRLLDSIKTRFGILFSSSGVSGAADTTNAAREQLKIFQDRGIVIVVIDRSDLENVASGENFISLLRERYEAVRLDSRVPAAG